MNRVEEIEAEIDRLDEIVRTKEKSWDYTVEFTNENYRKFIEYLKPENDKIAELSREKRLIMPYELSELPNYGDVMTIKKFIACVKAGGFIDDDGYGYYVKDGKKTDVTIHPSDVHHKALRKGFDTIIWFNR